MAMVKEPLLFARLPLGARRLLFGLVLFGICFLFAFPVLWLILTSLRPESGVYYVHRGTEFTLGNFAEVLADERIGEAFVNSALISTLATVTSSDTTVARVAISALLANASTRRSSCSTSRKLPSVNSVPRCT